ncbi:MAG: ABC transporter substrate-binding protein [Oscillospiraceae bacterium]|nr:ABC transporter substrate-binding protein [Oscillospiraceae bacterium]
MAVNMAGCAGNANAAGGAAPETTAAVASAATAATTAQTTQSNAAPANAASASASEAASAQTISLVFWHSMGGAAGEGIDYLVEQFNAQSGNIIVAAEFQGSYDDAITKLKASASSGQGPDIMQLYDIGTRWMIDSGYAVELQTVMERNGFDINQIEPNIAAYYSVDGRLNSMPFNSSTPLMYYNKDAFRAAGLDPEAPPKTMDELGEMAATLTAANNSPALAFYAYCWLFEQFTSKQGIYFVNNENGRAGTATAVEFDSNGAGINFFTKMDEWTKSGLNHNVGRDGTAAMGLFAAGQAQFWYGSTASLPSVIAAVGDNFELGVMPLPQLIPGVDGSVSIGGASFWMMNKGDDAAKDAVWKFIEYSVAPEFQIFYHKTTAYFPITIKSYDYEEMQKQLEERPLFVTAIHQLHASNPKGAGALIGVFTEARGIIEAHWEEMLNGAITPEELVERSARSINSAIEMYNQANS